MRNANSERNNVDMFGAVSTTLKLQCKNKLLSEGFLKKLQLPVRSISDMSLFDFREEKILLTYCFCPFALDWHHFTLIVCCRRLLQMAQGQECTDCILPYADIKNEI